MLSKPNDVFYLQAACNSSMIVEWRRLMMERREGETAAEYLERIPSFAREKSGLSKVREFLALLGNPDRKMQIFHVAGTNGKGSVCAFLSAVLKEAGIPFGTFTSPHLVDIRERFAVNGEMVSETEFSEAFDAVFRAVCDWMDMGNPHPTYFEYLFYMGLYLFEKRHVKVLVLETGMGGLKDVTNVIEHPLVSVITSVSIDHTAFLGDTVSEIAVHKAGIIKDGCPVVYDASPKEAEEVILKTAKARKAPAVPVGKVPFSMKEDHLLIGREYGGRMVEFEVPFPAPYQAENASLAIEALSLSGLGIDGETVVSGLKKTVWPARMEQIMPGIYLDGAHNEDGIREFLTAACLLKEERGPERIWLMFSVSADKEYVRMLSEIGESLCPDVCLLARMESKRALSLDELSKAAREVMPETVKIRCFETTDGALDTLLSERTDRDICFIAGSLYLAGEIKEKCAAYGGKT